MGQTQHPWGKCASRLAHQGGHTPLTKITLEIYFLLNMKIAFMSLLNFKFMSKCNKIYNLKG